MTKNFGTAMRRYRRTYLALLRASLVPLSLLVLIVLLCLRSASARADRSLLELGQHLMTLSESGLGEGSRGVLINGQSLGLRAFVTEQDLETTLDFYESWCRQGLGSFVDQQEALHSVDRSELTTADRSWRHLTRRYSEGDSGFVACLKHGVINISPRELGQRTMRFIETGNLAELGQFHYAAVKRIGGSTRVVASWTERDFFPLQMFPAQGDAPGMHAAHFSPPPSGRRMLSAGELGEDETLVVYIDCQNSVEDLRGYYRRDFARRGWQVMSDQSEGGDQRLFILQRGSAMRVVSIAHSEEQGSSVTVATTR